MLKPQCSPTRDLVRLDGLWRFGLDTEVGPEPWRGRLRTAREAPVPASYNDLFPDIEVRDHVGLVWYQRTVRVPRGWAGERVFVRLDSATHRGLVYVDDALVAEHVGGYLPFESDITDLVSPGGEFRLTVGVDNRLSRETIPPGFVVPGHGGRDRQMYLHDFFNYGGLARSVWLYSAPAERVTGLSVTTGIEGADGLVDYRVDLSDDAAGCEVRVTLRDAEERVVASGDGSAGRLRVADAELWRPGRGYLHELIVAVVAAGVTRDSYTLPVGIRTVAVRGREFLINGEPFHFTGFGKHEDSPVRGKGHDDAYLVHDFELMAWMGANSFRTSHYPYAEEVLDYADRKGIVVVAETAAVGLNLSIAAGHLGGGEVVTFGPDSFGDATRAAHDRHLQEMLLRDRNHPSIVMWSIANEPDARGQAAREYFEPLVVSARQLDPSRPLTYANMILSSPEKDAIADLFDVLSLNRYYGWYQDTGDVRAAEAHLEEEIGRWVAAYEKPIVLSEFGADAVAGLHAVVDQPWTEDYQVAMLRAFHRVIDRTDAVVGEQVWAFADFQAMSVTQRVDGNKKGVFTRDRRPKAAVHVLRERWTGIGR